MNLKKNGKLPSNLDQKVDMRKVSFQVIRPWIAKTVEDLLGFEDDVIVEYCCGILEDTENPVSSL